MEVFADQNSSPNEGPPAERQQGSLAQMLAEGRKAIGTHDTSNLFAEEDALTEAQQAAIKRNTELMQRAHAAFERSEKLRKIDRVKEVCPQATDEEAWQAVTLCEGKEEEAAAQIADPAFLAKVQACCRQATAAAAAATMAEAAVQPPGAQQAQRAQRSRAPAPKRPKRAPGEALPGSVFVGSFRGRGPLPAGGSSGAQRSIAQRDTAAAPSSSEPAEPAAPSSEPPEPVSEGADADQPANPGSSKGEADGAIQAPAGGSSDGVNLASDAPGDAPAEGGMEGQAAAAAAEQPAAVEGGEGGPAKGAAAGKGKKKKKGGKAPAAVEPEEVAAAESEEAAAAEGSVAAGEAAPCSDPEEAPAPPKRASQRKPKRKGPAAGSAPPCSDPEEVPAPPKPASQQKPKRKAAAAEVTASEPDQGVASQPLRRSPRKHRAGPSKASPKTVAAAAAAATASGPADAEAGGGGPQGDGTSPEEGNGGAADDTSSEGAAKPAKKKARAGKKGAKGGVAVPRGAAHRGRVRRTSSKAAELVSVGQLRAAAGWFNEGYIFPAGFQSRVHFRSSVQLDQLCVHECHIVGRGGEHWPAPTFRVVALDRASEPLTAKSCTGCWTGVLKRINAEIERRRAAGEDLPPAPKTAIAGPEYFGLNQEDVQNAIEALDPDHECEAYWEGKARRAAVAAGLPPAAPKGARPPGGAPRAASARGGGAGRKRRRGASSDDESAEEAEREEDEEGAAPHRQGLHVYPELAMNTTQSPIPEEDEEVIPPQRCSAADRRERYRARHGSDAGAGDADNPLPGLIDPITLGPVVHPAISPHGHVCGLSTWKAVLANDGACPWTRQHFSWEACTVLTHSNIERFRGKIKAADPPPQAPPAAPAGDA